MRPLTFARSSAMRMLLAVLCASVLCETATAGPLLDRLRGRRGASSANCGSGGAATANNCGQSVGSFATANCGGGDSAAFVVPGAQGQFGATVTLPQGLHVLTPSVPAGTYVVTPLYQTSRGGVYLLTPVPEAGTLRK